MRAGARTNLGGMGWFAGAKDRAGPMRPTFPLPPPLTQDAWGVGVMKGPAPSDLVPLERLQPRQDAEGAWPVANPVLSCATPGMDFVPSHGV